MDTGWKKYIFFISETAHADMRIKLRYDNLAQREFFKILIKAYVEDNLYMRELIKQVNSEKISKRSLKKMLKDEKKVVQEEEFFALNEEEINDIYDQIELGESDD